MAQSLLMAVLEWLWARLFPKLCFGCGREGQYLCAGCRERLPTQKQQCCVVCGRQNRYGSLCSGCGDHNLTAVISAYRYQEPLIGQLIRACKYRFAYNIGEELGGLLAAFWLDYLKQSSLLAGVRPRWLAPAAKLLVIPLPLAAKRERWRGFNQAAILARAVAQASGLTCQENTLFKIKNTKPQAKLATASRWSNVVGCFAWSGDNLAGRSILLVDDVATTGATLAQAALTLKQAGAGQVVGLVLAHG